MVDLVLIASNLGSHQKITGGKSGRGRCSVLGLNDLRRQLSILIERPTPFTPIRWLVSPCRRLNRAVQLRRTRKVGHRADVISGPTFDGV